MHAFLHAAVDHVGAERRRALDEVAHRRDRENRQIRSGDEHGFVGGKALEPVAQAVANAYAVGPKVVGRPQIRISPLAGRRNDGDPSDRRAAAQHLDDAPDQRRTADVDEGFVRRAGLQLRDVVQRTAGENDGVHRHSGVVAKRVRIRSNVSGSRTRCAIASSVSPLSASVKTHEPDPASNALLAPAARSASIAAAISGARAAVIVVKIVLQRRFDGGEIASLQRFEHRDRGAAVTGALRPLVLVELAIGVRGRDGNRRPDDQDVPLRNCARGRDALARTLDERRRSRKKEGNVGSEVAREPQPVLRRRRPEGAAHRCAQNGGRVAGAAAKARLHRDPLRQKHAHRRQRAARALERLHGEIALVGELAAIAVEAEGGSGLEGQLVGQVERHHHAAYAVVPVAAPGEHFERQVDFRGCFQSAFRWPSREEAPLRRVPQ